jgi:hypothetical protein
MAAYWPMGRLALFNNPVGRLAWWWMTVGVPKGKLTVVPMSLRGEAIITDVAE